MNLTYHSYSQNSWMQHSANYGDANDSVVLQVPLALVLLSLKWWENFVHDNRGPFKLKDIKTDVGITRNKMSILTGVWGILVTVGKCISNYIVITKSYFNPTNINQVRVRYYH